MTVRRCSSDLEYRVSARCDHLCAAYAIAREEGLHELVPVTRDANHAGYFDRDYSTCVGDSSLDRGGVVRAGGVLGRVRDVVGLVAYRRHHHRAALLRKLDRASLSVPDRSLARVVF